MKKEAKFRDFEYKINPLLRPLESDVRNRFRTKIRNSEYEEDIINHLKWLKEKYNIDIDFDEIKQELEQDKLKEEQKIKAEENKQVPEEYLEILKDPNLLDNINKELDKKIEGEYETRKTILIVANGRNVANPNDNASYNLMINSSSGAGKDYVTSNVLSILPDEEVIKKKRISKKVFTYWHNAKFEPTWTWNKKIFYGEDISNSVLNEDVFKIMASSGNANSTIIINQIAVDIEVKGKPVVIITIAEANPKLENLRRFPNSNLDEKEDQTKRIMEKQAKFAKTGKPIQIDDKYKNSLSYLKRVKVIIPYADDLTKVFPNIHLILRTNFNRFLDYIKASCSLYQYQRQQDENGYYIAEEQDYNNAIIPLIKTTTNAFTIPITNNQKKILNIFQKLTNKKSDLNERNKEYTTTELSPEMPFISRRRLEDNLDDLVQLGFLKTSSKQLEYEKLNFKGEKVTLKGREAITYQLVEFVDLKIPKFEDIVTKNKSNMSITSNKSNTSNKSIIKENKGLDMDDKDDIDVRHQDAQILKFTEIKQKVGVCVNCNETNPIYWIDQKNKEFCVNCKEKLSK